METHATVYLRRRLGLRAGAVPFQVMIDDKLVAKVRSGSYVEFSVPAGWHVLQLKCDSRKGHVSTPLDLELGGGDRYELACKHGWSGPEVWDEPRSAGAGNTTGRTSISAIRSRVSPGREDSYSFSILEETRSSRSIGNDVIDIDNSDGVAEVERQLTLSKEWVREFTLAYEDETTKTLSLGLGPTWLAIKAGFENCLTERYSIRSQETRRFEEQMTVRVPER